MALCKQLALPLLLSALQLFRFKGKICFKRLLGRFSQIFRQRKKNFSSLKVFHTWRVLPNLWTEKKNFTSLKEFHTISCDSNGKEIKDVEEGTGHPSDN